MVLSANGSKIYHDPPIKVQDFFSQYDITLKKYKNPADELLKFA